MSTVSISVATELEKWLAVCDSDTSTEWNPEWERPTPNLRMAGRIWAATGFTKKGAKNSLGEEKNMGGIKGVEVRKRGGMASMEGEAEVEGSLSRMID